MGGGHLAWSISPLPARELGLGSPECWALTSTEAVVSLAGVSPRQAAAAGVSQDRRAAVKAVVLLLQAMEMRAARYRVYRSSRACSRFSNGQSSKRQTGSAR